MFARLRSRFWFSQLVGIGFGLLVGATFLLLIRYGLTEIIAALTSQPTDQVVYPVFSLSTGLLFLCFITSIVVRYGRSRIKGALLVDCGRSSLDYFVLATSVTGLMLVTVFGNAFADFGAQDLGLLSLLAYNTTMGLSKPQIRQNGFWVRTHLIPWSSVVSYWWPEPLLLRVSTRGFLGLAAGASFRIPGAKKQAVVNLLDEHIPGRVIKLEASIPGGWD